MWAWTGSALSGIDAQKHWGRNSWLNLINVPRFVLEFHSFSCVHGFKGSVLDRFLFLLTLYTLPWMWRYRRIWILWTYSLAILPAMSGGFTSYVRFGSAAFPTFLVIGAVLSRPLIRTMGLVAVASSLLFHAFAVWRFVNYQWVG